MIAALRPFPSKMCLFLDGIRSNVKIDFLKKCKKVGLLDDLFEEILDKLHLIQERLMDETASESGIEIATFLHVEASHKPTCKTKQKVHLFFLCGFFFFALSHSLIQFNASDL